MLQTNRQTSLRDSIKNHVKKMTKVIVYGVYFLDDKQWILESIYKHKYVAEYKAHQLQKQSIGKTQIILHEMYI